MGSQVFRFSLGYNPVCCYLSVVEIVLAFGPVISSCSHGFGGAFTFWHHRLTLYFSAPALESSTAPRSLSSCCWRMVFKSQDLGAKCAHCYLVITAFRSSHVTELGNHPTLYICVPFCVYLCNMKTDASSSEATNSIQHERAHSHLPQLLPCSCLWRRKPGSCYLYCVCLPV